MQRQYRIFDLVFSLGVILCFISNFGVNSVYAASTVMSFSPQTGVYGKQFSVDLVIDGHGDSFNAAQATLTVPKSLSIQSLTLGNCNLSFTTTPSNSDPSFQGIILGGSSQKCSVYTLTLIPVKAGNAIIPITHASVRRFGDASEVLSSVGNGTYTLTAIANASTIATPAIKPARPTDPYTVVLTILATQDGAPIPNTQVTLNTPSKDKQQTQTTNGNGTVTFTDLPSGIYIASIPQAKGQTQDTVLNLSGRNHTLALSIRLQLGSTSVVSPVNPIDLGKKEESSPSRKVNFAFFLVVTLFILMVGAIWVIHSHKTHKPRSK